MNEDFIEAVRWMVDETHRVIMMASPDFSVKDMADMGQWDE